VCTQALELVRRARLAGQDVTAETCPHYLFFTDQDYLRLGPYAKINPPLRSAADRAALWGGLTDRTLDLVTTDHSTFLAEEKERGWHEVWRAPSGAPGVQTLVPILMTAALAGRITLPDVARLIAAAPARVFGLTGRKGALDVGCDGDLCLYDPRGEHVFTPEQMVSQAAAVDRLYAGMRFRGRVHATIARGRTVYREGLVLAARGSGGFLAAGQG
jgi:dihydroorotase-like cyclic amidohydrolase